MRDRRDRGRSHGDIRRHTRTTNQSWRGRLAACSIAIAGVLLFACVSASAESNDPCSKLDQKLAEWANSVPEHAAKKTALKSSGQSDNDANRQIALEYLVKQPSPFDVVLSSTWLPGGKFASVSFIGKQITATTDPAKICVDGFASSSPSERVKIDRVFITTATDDHKPHLQAVFAVNAPSGFWYDKDTYSFAGIIDGADPTFFSYSITTCVSNGWFSGLAAVLFVLLAYVFLAFITYRQDLRRQARKAKAAAGGAAAPQDDAGNLKGGHWLVYTLSPVRITAGMFGEASLSQLQVMLFTFIVAGLLFQLLLRTGVLSNLSADLLFLLGISAVGGATGRFTETLKTGLSAAAERYLIGKGWYNWDTEPLRKHATFARLLMTDGRLDVYKFQMAIFTVVVAAYVISAGQSDLSNVSISQTVLYLIGISQGVYVGGKAVTDRTADLEAAVAKMIDLESQMQILLKNPPADAADFAARKNTLLAQYQEAAQTAANEFAPLQHRVIPTGAKDDIRPDVLEPTGVPHPAM